MIDYSGNLALHGGICAGMEDAYQEDKKGTVTKVSSKPNPKAKRKVRKADEVTDLDPMLASPKGLRAEVAGVTYVAIGSKTQPGKRLLMVNYDCRCPGGALVTASEFVCVEYNGYARQKAEEWFTRRGGYAPFSADRAQIACWGLPTPREVTIRKNNKYMNVIAEHF